MVAVREHVVLHNKLRSDLECLFDAAIKPTKRERLRLVMSILGPLGIVASFVFEGKVIIQEIWRANGG